MIKLYIYYIIISIQIAWIVLVINNLIAKLTCNDNWFLIMTTDKGKLDSKPATHLEQESRDVLYKCFIIMSQEIKWTSVWALHKIQAKKSDQIKGPNIEKNIIWIHLQSKCKNLIHSSWFSIQTSTLISKVSIRYDNWLKLEFSF